MSDIVVRNEGNGTQEQRAIEKLGTEQHAALEMLLGGKSVAETARSAGVARATVYRWLKDDPNFRAAYNLWHEEMEESCRSRLLMMTDKAAGAVEKALEAGDAKTALQLLKGMGLITAQKEPRVTDAEELAKRQKIEADRRHAKLTWDDLESGFGLGK